MFGSLTILETLKLSQGAAVDSVEQNEKINSPTKLSYTSVSSPSELASGYMDLYQWQKM